MKHGGFMLYNIDNIRLINQITEKKTTLISID